MSGHFPKEDIQMTKMHMKRGSRSSVIRKMQNKPSVRYFCIPQMAKITHSDNTKCCLRFYGYVKWYSHHGKQYVSYKTMQLS